MGSKHLQRACVSQALFTQHSLDVLAARTDSTDSKLHQLLTCTMAAQCQANMHMQADSKRATWLHTAGVTHAVFMCKRLPCPMYPCPLLLLSSKGP